VGFPDSTPSLTHLISSCRTSPSHSLWSRFSSHAGRLDACELSRSRLRPPRCSDAAFPTGGGSPIFHRFRFPRPGPWSAASVFRVWSGRGRSLITFGGVPFHPPSRVPSRDGSLGRAQDTFRSPSIGSLALGSILTRFSPVIQARTCGPSFGQALDRPLGLSRSPLLGSLA
jgi:hypothetical protein